VNATDIALMFALFLASAIRISIPLLIGTLGETLTERSGHLNLGVEGMMLLGASTGFLVAVRTQNVVLAMLAAMGGAGAGALLFALMTVTFRANQVVTGLALTIFGAGVANTLGKSITNENTPQNIRDLFAWKPLHADLSGIQGIPVLGPVAEFVDTAFLQHNLYVYGALLGAALLAFFLYRTHAGLHLRAVGENPAAADASGIRVIATRYAAIVFGGMLCGLAGLYMPLVHITTWVENITGGRGWIVVALVIFVRWDPLKAILGAFLFGALEIVGFRLQAIPQLAGSIFFSQYLIDMYPYLMTILVLVMANVRKKKGWQGPGALGIPYFREER
jgi:general nucleoside transport system permease protein